MLVPSTTFIIMFDTCGINTLKFSEKDDNSSNVDSGLYADIPQLFIASCTIQ
jgi:hypothetical protein